MDRATYLSLKSGLTLSVLVEKDETLLNYISLIPVNPNKFPAVNHKDTMTFVNWLTSPAKGQAIISDFGKEKYGSAMFSRTRKSGPLFTRKHPNKGSSATNRPTRHKFTIL